jgi:parvulin-like peptidyl-prolyl isomerase
MPLPAVFACTCVLLLALFLPAAATAQTQAGQTGATDKPLATVNGVAVKSALLQQALQQALAQGRPDSPQLREMIANQLVARELFVQAAAKQGLDKEPDVLAIAEEAKRSAMVQRYLRQTLKPNAVTEEQTKAQYEKLKAGIGAKEYKLRVMLLPNDVRAKELRAELAKGKDFAELARQWSLAPSATRGGELEWVSFKSPAQEGQTSGLPLPIAAAVEKLQKGKVSDPIGLQGKWWLVKLDDLRPTKVPTYEQARQGIYNALAAQELERVTTELVKQLSQAATITR